MQYNKEYEELLKMFYVLDADAMQFYSTYKLHNGKPLQPCYIRQYIINASVLLACIKLAKVMASNSKKRVATNLHWYASTLNSHLKEKFNYEHTLPTSGKYFSQHFKAFYNDGNQVQFAGAISGKLGNENAVKDGKQYQFSSN